jgi:hypothetical protein
MKLEFMARLIKMVIKRARSKSKYSWMTEVQLTLVQVSEILGEKDT